MSFDLVPTESGKRGMPQLYARMQTAIAKCHAVDDCKNIADQASAIAAYYKQIKDDESVRRFIQIKLRAWRRIGEIMNEVDDKDCDTAAAHCRKIKETIPDDIVQNMSDWTISNAIKLARLPDDFFEDNVEEHRSVDSLLSAYKELQQEAWLATKEGKAWKAQQAEDQKRWAKEREEREKKAAEEDRLRREEEVDDRMEYLEFRHALDEAFGDVGVTMDRRDRKQMKQVILLIKEPVHAMLRQAAFDKHMTMQAVLRAGLKMWFAAHDYDVKF